MLLHSQTWIQHLPMANRYKKWMVVLVNLSPTIGVEITKTRPCLIISPNVVNKHLQTVIIAPLTSTQRNIPTRLPSNFNGHAGEICFDQMKAIDIVRIIKVLGNIDMKERSAINYLLQQFFSEM